MESYQPISSSFKSPASVVDSVITIGGITSRDAPPMTQFSDAAIGVLEVFIHQARDIHNICIYHKQDVYASLCLTSDPEATVSSRIINGAGRNPVFNETLRLDVKTVESSLKCEVWMMSRVKNYLEDQLLGFALVPLSDVVLGNGKLVREFSLSSTDLFHSPAGFVELSINYFGSSPDVMAIRDSPKSTISDDFSPDFDRGDSVPCKYEKIEFPDLKIVKENQMMVSEYFGVPCSGNLITSDNGTDDNDDDDAGMRIVESFATENRFDSPSRKETPQRSITTNGSPSNHSFSDPLVTIQKEKMAVGAECENNSIVGFSGNVFVPPPLININIEPDQSVVRQEIVDMYMKSMQQFTDSLAKMKLPVESKSNSSNNSAENTSLGSEQQLQAPKGTGSRVFYGSRAFF